MPVSFEVSYYVPVLLILSTRFVHISLLNNKHCTPSSALYVPQQRSAVPCVPDAPCFAFCGAVSCGAVLSFAHTAVVSGMIQVPGNGVYVLCTRLFAFFS